MNALWNAGKNRTHLGALPYLAGVRPLHLGEMIYWLASFCHPSNFDKGCTSKRIFLTEQCGNVIENKAPPWETWG
jgi:hypothetical protein